MAQKKETRIQNEIRTDLSKYGVVFRMNSGLFFGAGGQPVRVGVPGMSDLLYIGEPYTSGTPTVAWIEVKTLTGKAREEQETFIEAMQKLGCKAGIARSTQAALDIIFEKEIQQ